MPKLKNVNCPNYWLARTGEKTVGDEKIPNVMIYEFL
jgi:hypothetical protein